MPIKTGHQLGPYEIVALIGSGGMGEVYRARDPRLRRDVAIKISAEQFSDRFEREARAIAALNHPNICTLHDVGPNYLVMELVEGENLTGPLPLEQALNVAGQIAAALEAAHEKGIVHRDLKPANIKIKPDGTVKVLDFGLAKSAARQELTPDSPTTLSIPGMIVGTAAYMAPEQARGQNVDKRADIWSFGVVLYEMVTGSKLFEGSNLTEVLAAVVRAEPDLRAAPPELRRLLSKCLQKDPKKRLRDIGDAWELLGAPSADSPAPRPIAWIAAAAALAVALAVLALVHFRQKSPEMPMSRFVIDPPEKTSFAATPPALSPDGRHLVFSAQSADGKTQLWLRSLDSTAAQPITGTENGQAPFWSPDSKSIGFFADGKLKRIEAAGGAALALADAPVPRGGTWSADGVIVFTPGSTGPLQRVSASGGATTPLRALDIAKESVHRWPWFLPDGRHFVFFGGFGGISHGAIQVGSLDSPGSRMLVEADSNAVYAQGYLLFLRGNTLMAQPFDANAQKLSGEPRPVAQPLESSAVYANFSSSANGELVYAGGAGAGQQLIWFGRAGNRTGTLGEPGDVSRPYFSPDRKSLVVSIADSSSHNSDIWIYDVMRALRTRFTFDPAAELQAVWSPDGGTIVFDSNRRGPGDLYRKRSDGSGGEELFYADGFRKVPTSWSPDGKIVLYHVANDPNTGYDIQVLPSPLGPPGASKPYPFLHTQFNELNAQFSPDGKWIAYQSDESGQYEIYATPFPGPGGKRQISTGGGQYPRWRSDGKEVFYVSNAGQLNVVEVSERGDSLDVGKSTPLFGGLPLGYGHQYDVSADGQRILAVVPSTQANSATLTLVQNWTAALRR